MVGALYSTPDSEHRSSADAVYPAVAKYVAAGGSERPALQLEVLVARRDAGIANKNGRLSLMSYCLHDSVVRGKRLRCGASVMCAAHA